MDFTFASYTSPISGTAVIPFILETAASILSLFGDDIFIIPNSPTSSIEISAPARILYRQRGSSENLDSQGWQDHDRQGHKRHRTGLLLLLDR